MGSAWRQNNDLGRIGRSVRSLTWMSDSWSCEPSYARPPSSSWLTPWLNLPPKRSGRVQVRAQVTWLTPVVEILGDALLASGRLACLLACPACPLAPAAFALHAN